MNGDQCRELVRGARVARLATHGSGGRIDVVPIVFALDGERLVTAVDHKPKRTMRLQRLANIEADPSVAILVDHYDDADWTALWWVRGRGLARVVHDGPVHAAALSALTRKYPQYRDRRPAGAVIVVDDLAWTGWSAA